MLVTHHVDEIPPGFTHALLLRAGRTLAAGPLHDVVTAEHLSECFDLPLRLEAAGRTVHGLGALTRSSRRARPWTISSASNRSSTGPQSAPLVAQEHVEPAAGTRRTDGGPQHPRRVLAPVVLPALEPRAARRGRARVRTMRKRFERANGPTRPRRSIDQAGGSPWKASARVTIVSHAG